MKEDMMSELPNESTPNAATPNDGTVELTESQLSEVAGGLLLPAVQKIREAASRTNTISYTGLE
jgi:hypothetical protein